MDLTYCNPLSIANIPDGKPLDCSQLGNFDFPDFRSISDPRSFTMTENGSCIPATGWPMCPRILSTGAMWISVSTMFATARP